MGIKRSAFQPPQSDFQDFNFGAVDREITGEEVLELLGVQPGEFGTSRELNQVAAHVPIDDRAQLFERIGLRDGCYVHTVVQVELRLKIPTKV